MIKLGKVYGNLMVDVRATNEKLRARALRIVIEAANCSEKIAVDALSKTNGSAKAAIDLILKNRAADR